MAWKKVLPMDERARFVLEADREEINVSELCRRYGVSRKTGHKWINRYKSTGLEGIKDISRRPHRCPHRTSPEWEERVVNEKLRHPSWGPKKIRQILIRQGYEGQVPAASTIGGILSRWQLVKPRRRSRRRKGSVVVRLTEAMYPNHVWAVDYKGWFRTGDGQRCEPLTISDVYSRYVLEVRVLGSQSYEGAKGVFERVFERYGLPQVIRTDNGTPFASVGVGGLSRLSVWWVVLGVRPECISPGHPEQNGVHERMHLSLDEATAQPAQNLEAQQRRFDSWRAEFNEQRPHEALGMQTPAQRYERSSSKYDNTHKREISYPRGYKVRRVRTNGCIKWRGERRFIGEALSGMLVGIKEVDGGRNQVYFDSIVLGELYDVDYKKGLRPVSTVTKAGAKNQIKV
ncbi:MAG: IS481 family transposase [Acidobacteriota bacterium]